MNDFFGSPFAHIKYPICFDLCDSPSKNKIFAEIIDKYHSYKKFAPSPGRSIRWNIFETQTGNLIGAIGLSSAVLAVSSRDKFIGWDEKTKLRNLNMVANNSRFALIRKNTTIKNTGSMVLKQLRIIGAKLWKEKYSNNLTLIETFVEPIRSEELDGQKLRTGSIYLSDNWIEVGMTAGASIQKNPFKLWLKETGKRGDLARKDKEECLRVYGAYLGNTDGSGRKITKSQKKIVFLKPLVDDWKKILNS